MKMGTDLIKLMYERASKTKDPDQYVQIAKQLYGLMELSDKKFVKEMKWDKPIKEKNGTTN